MGNGTVHLAILDGVAAVTLDRLGARNATTWAMYAQLGDICEQRQADASVRVATFRRAGGKALVAGTDIGQFAAFRSRKDGLAYERQIDQCI